MKKLPKETLALLDLLRTSAEQAHADLMDSEATAANAIADVNEHIAKLNEAIEAYNEALSQAASEVEEYVSERSDKWQESDKAEEYSTWIDALQSATIDETFEEVERMDIIDTLEIPELPELGG